jgi:RNA polymerase sigma-70 factor (ECF subfamily)
MLAAAAERSESRGRPSLEALEHCVERLPDRWRRLLAMRYGHGDPPERIAAEIGTTISAVYQALWRLRARLRECMERYLTTEAGA